MGGGFSSGGALSPKGQRMRRIGTSSVTKATILMRLLQRRHASGSTWQTFAIMRAQLGDRRLRAGSDGRSSESDAADWRAPLTRLHVLAVEKCAVLPGIGDMVAHAGKPLERIHRLEVTSQEGAWQRVTVALEIWSRDPSSIAKILIALGSRQGEEDA